MAHETNSRSPGGVSDTDEACARIQVALLRDAGPARRALIASDLTNAALARARRGIAIAHAELSDLERKLLFVEVHYGADLAAAVRARLHESGKDP